MAEPTEIWETYPEVYHYTGFDSALNILESTILRATFLKQLQLGDDQEIIYAKNIISSELLKRFDEATMEDAMHDLNNFYEAVGGNFYITSFCGINDDLTHSHRENGLSNMWEIYGSDEGGSGCAIIFKTEKIWSQAKKHKNSQSFPPALIMDEVIYQGVNDDKEEYLEKLSRFAKNVQQFLENHTDESSQREKLFDELCKDQLYLMALTKDPKYCEEREVRIGFCFTKHQEIENLSSSPEEYIEIPFSPDQDISHIIIGPHRDQKQKLDCLNKYLTAKDLNIYVTKSTTPLT